MDAQLAFALFLFLLIAVCVYKCRMGRKTGQEELPAKKKSKEVSKKKETGKVKETPVKKKEELSSSKKKEGITASTNKEISQKKNVQTEKEEKRKLAGKAKVPEAINPQLYQLLRGHQDDVEGVEITPDGRCVVSCSRDRTLRLWRLDSPKDAPMYRRVNIDLNHGTALAVSQDKNGSIYIAMALALGTTKTIQFYGVPKGGDKKEQPVPKLLHSFNTTHKDEIKIMKIAPNNAFICTFASSGDTSLLFWTLKGELIQSISVNQIQNKGLFMSSDGKFLSVTSMLSGVKVFEMIYDKDSKSTLQRVEHVMTLTGHSATVNAAAFGPDNETMATSSLDGTWKLWNISVRYKDREDPKILYTSKPEDSKGDELGLLAISPVRTKNKGLTIALACGTNIHFYNNKGELLEVIEHAQRDYVKALTFSSNGKLLLTTGPDKNIRIWRTPTEAQ